MAELRRKGNGKPNYISALYTDDELKTPNFIIANRPKHIHNAFLITITVLVKTTRNIYAYINSNNREFADANTNNGNTSIYNTNHARTNSKLTLYYRRNRARGNYFNNQITNRSIRKANRHRGAHE